MYDRTVVRSVKSLYARKKSLAIVGKSTGLSKTTVWRIVNDHHQKTGKKIGRHSVIDGRKETRIEKFVS